MNEQLYALQLTQPQPQVLVWRITDRLDGGTCSVVQVCLERETGRIYITDVCTYRGYEGRGLATFLLQQLLAFARREHFTMLKLDDCSDLFQHPRNLYLKLGFRYIVDGQPEMELQIK